MKIYLKTVTTLSLGLLLLAACNSNNNPQRVDNENPDAHIVKVLEVQNATSYTYLFVEEGKDQYWMAIPKTEVEVGAVVQYNKAMLMENFESRDLKKTFDKVYFVEQIIDPNAKPVNKALTVDEAHEGVGAVAVDHVIAVEPAEGGGISLKELFENREKYDGKIVRVRGEVVKLNEGILDHTWVHIQDGSGDGTNNYDLTVTTNDEVWEGSIFTFDGKVSLDKDFGSGYVYEIIVEDAKKIQIVKKVE